MWEMWAARLAAVLEGQLGEARETGQGGHPRIGDVLAAG